MSWGARRGRGGRRLRIQRSQLRRNGNTWQIGRNLRRCRATRFAGRRPGLPLLSRLPRCAARVLRCRGVDSRRWPDAARRQRGFGNVARKTVLVLTGIDRSRAVHRDFRLRPYLSVEQRSQHETDSKRHRRRPRAPEESRRDLPVASRLIGLGVLFGHLSAPRSGWAESGATPAVEMSGATLIPSGCNAAATRTRSSRPT